MYSNKISKMMSIIIELGVTSYYITICNLLHVYLHENLLNKGNAWNVNKNLKTFIS